MYPQDGERIIEMGENIQVDGDDEKDEKIAKENEVVLKYGLVLSYF